jgi:hypothetical protein
MSEPTGSAPAGGMPAGGVTPSAPAAPYGGVVSPAVAASDEMPDGAPDDAAEGTEQVPAAPPGGTPAGAGAEPGLAPIPPTPQQAEIVSAAQQYHAAATRIQQELPQVQMGKKTLETQLAPYVNNPALLEQLPPEAQYAVRQGYAQWQQYAQREHALTQGMAEIERVAPILQTMFALEQRTAVLNQVGEPVAYQLLARRAAERSGDPNFPVSDLMEFLRGIPPHLLEQQAEKFEHFYRQGRLRERSAGMVDAMGPGGGSTAGSRAAPQGGRDMIRDAIDAELRKRPAR